MLEWLLPKPRPPVDTLYKAWVESRMLWLADHIGIERMMKAKVVRPTAEDFPEHYIGTAEDVPPIMHRLCGVIGVDPLSVDLEIVDARQIPEAAGQYEPAESGRAIIRLAESTLADLQSVVATLAHELAHVLLLGRGLLTVEDADHEHVTDLLPVFLGLGIFQANATVTDRATREGNWEIFRIRRHGYLPSHVQGYALALFAYVRGEQRPEWAGHLRLDASSALAAGLRYLEKTEDTLFHPLTVRRRPRELSIPALVETLLSGTPSARLAALWQLRPRVPADPDLLEAVLSRLQDQDEDIRAEAASLVGEHGLAPDRAPALLGQALSRAHGDSRAAIAWAMSHLKSRGEEVVPQLITLLEDSDDLTVHHAASALGEFGPQARSAALPLLDALTRALIDCRYSIIDALASSVASVVPDLRPVLEEYYAERDPELRDRAYEALGITGEVVEGS
jgi:hypothetical protein